MHLAAQRPKTRQAQRQGKLAQLALAAVTADILPFSCGDEGAAIALLPSRPAPPFYCALKGPYLQDAVSGWPVLSIHGQQLLHAVLGLHRDTWPGGCLEIDLTLYNCPAAMSSSLSAFRVLTVTGMPGELPVGCGRQTIRLLQLDTHVQSQHGHRRAHIRTHARAPHTHAQQKEREREEGQGPRGARHSEGS